MLENFDATAAERHELDILLDRGYYSFTLPKKSLFRFWGKPVRTWTIRRPYRGTQAYVDRELIDLDFDEQRLQREGLPEAKRLMAHNNARIARIVAIAVLRDQWKIWLLKGLLTHYFLWRIDSHNLHQVLGWYTPLMDHPNFTLSIRYLSIQKRMTTPALMETPEETKQPIPD